MSEKIGSSSPEVSRYMYLCNITKQPPSDAYPEEWFEIELTITTKDKDSVKSDLPISLQASLLELAADGSNRTVACDAAKLTIHPSTPLENLMIRSQSFLLVKCKVDCITFPTDRKVKLCIQFSLQLKEQIPSVAFHVARTAPVHLVRYKFAVEGDTEDAVWYKDEGGRDKCMMALVKLHCSADAAADGAALELENSPLRIRLCYADTAHDKQELQVVGNQEILKVLGRSKIYIDSSTKKAMIRYRIDEVSKSHQGHKFQLEISSDRLDVAPTYTRPVCVRSKRNKRQKLELLSSKIPPTSFAEITPPRPFHYDASNSSAISTTTDTADAPQSAEVGDAIRRIHDWIETAATDLESLQWKVIGYATKPDGSVDFNHPYHEMPNPNDCISNLLAMYSNSTRSDLCLIESATEATLSQQHLENEPPLSNSISSEATSLDDTNNPSPGNIVPFSHHHSPSAATNMDETSKIRTNSLFNVLKYARNDAGENSDELQSHVMYVLASVNYRDYQGRRIIYGLPAFNAQKQLLGFFRELPVSSSSTNREIFVPVSWFKDDFGPFHQEQATQILSIAIESRIEVVHCVTDYDSLSALLEDCFRFANANATATGVPKS